MKKEFILKATRLCSGVLRQMIWRKEWGVPQTRPLADFLPTLTIKAKDFATELTSHNVVEKDLNGDSQITNEHIENNLAVRKILGERGINLKVFQR